MLDGRRRAATLCRAMTDKPPPPDRTPAQLAAEARAARSAAALRENLRRRKAQSRARDAAPADSGPADKPPPAED
jgi:hypothetical protein